MNVGAAFGSAAFAFFASLVVLFIISAILPGVNVSVIYWSFVVGLAVFVLALISSRY